MAFVQHCILMKNMAPRTSIRISEGVTMAREWFIIPINSVITGEAIIKRRARANTTTKITLIQGILYWF